MNKIIRTTSILFIFTLPFCIYMKIAAQLISLVLSCILLPSYILINKTDHQDYKKFRKLGLLTLSFWLISPIWNIAHFLLINEPSRAFSKKIFHSHFPSAFMITGVALFVLSLFLEFFKTRIKNLNNRNYTATFFKPITNGCICACIFFIALALFQRQTNFSLEFPTTFDLSLQRSYRVKLFSTHTLLLASTSLAILVFSISFIYICQKRDIFLPAKIKNIFILLSLTNIIILALNQSRTALAIACIACSIFTILYFKNIRQSRLFHFLVLIFVAIFFLVLNQKWNTLRLSPEDIAKDLRWQIWTGHLNMFLSRPFFGHSSFFLTEEYKSMFYPSNNIDLETYQAHNVFLQILVDTGLIGFLFTALTAFACLKSYCKMTCEKNLVYTPILFQSLLWSLLANTLHGMTQNNLFESSTACTYIILSWVIFWIRIEEKNQHSFKMS